MKDVHRVLEDADWVCLDVVGLAGARMNKDHDGRLGLHIHTGRTMG